MRVEFTLRWSGICSGNAGDDNSMENLEQEQIQMKKLKDLRKMKGMNRREFSEYMGIPLRTMEEWEAGRRKMPDYVLRLISYRVKVEKVLEESEIERTDYYGE